MQPKMRSKFIRPLAIGGLGPAIMLIVILTAVRPWLNSTGQAQSPSAIVTDSPRETFARPQPPVAVKPRAAVKSVAIVAPRRVEIVKEETATLY